MKTSTFSSFVIVLMTGLNTGCMKHPLSPLDYASNVVVGYGAIDAHICSSAPSPAVQNLKYLFILDHSSSNQPGFPISPGDVTNSDAQGTRRYGPLVDFINPANFVADPTSPTSYDLIDFNDIAAEVLPLNGFTSDAAAFMNVITSDWKGSGTPAVPVPFDSGFTNYQAALKLAKQVITKDLQIQAANPVNPVVKTSYVIIFVSDGLPIVGTGNSASPTYMQTFATDLSPTITDLKDLRNDPLLGSLVSNVTLNTAYYNNGLPDASAVSLLQTLAIAGNGQYLQFNAGQNVLYQRFAPPSREIRNELVDVFVENQNAVWWTDGSFLQDSDGDGLPDMVEAQNNSNPNAVDSDGNGVSDLVEFRTKGHPCNDANCAPAGRDKYAICAGFSPATDGAGNVTFSSSTNDGLNDCEKFLLGGNRNSFNSNGDLIPDEYAFKSSLPIIAGSGGSAFSDPFLDGITNYSKLKMGLPLAVSLKTLLDIEHRQTAIVAESSPSPDIACYHFTVGKIALSASNNRVKVMIVQNSSGVEDRPFLKVAYARFSEDHTTVTLSPGDFK